MQPSKVESSKNSPTPVGPRSKRKTHAPMERPPFERIALILQGGGALGAYQAGVYQALAETDLCPSRRAR
jgi:predicted acylesterase/phospholipase RssA